MTIARSTAEYDEINGVQILGKPIMDEGDRFLDVCGLISDS